MTSSNKIKVLFRHRSMEMGGVEKVMLSIINNLNPEKFDITVCLNLNQGELRNEFPFHVRKVYLTDGSQDFSKNPIVKKLQFLIRRRKLNTFRKHPQIIDKKYLNENYDIEIGMTYNDFEYILQSSNKISKKIGWFHSEISLPKLQPLVPRILQQFPLFDHIVYCSENIKSMMHLEYPTLRYPTESVITNAIPIEEIRKKSLDKISDFSVKKIPTFISIGRLHTRKGYHKLIEAHTKLINDGFKHEVIIIGEGEEKNNLNKQIKDSGVENTFHLLGNKMNPYPYLREADYFIMSSESEAWPLVIAEAMILQKPIIATNTGDVSKMITNDKTGFLISYETQEMYDAMKKFMREPEYILKLKENLTDIEKQFDNQKIFDAVENIITNLAKK